MSQRDLVLTPEEDALSLSLLRAHATRVMLSCVRECNPSCDGIPVCLGLTLVDDPESAHVSISLNKPDEGALPGSQLSCQITATPAWIERSTEHQIKAVIAHEIGHAVNGDLVSERAPAMLRLEPLCDFLSWAFLLMAMAMNILSASIAWVFLLLASLVVALYSSGMSALYAYHSRQCEYKADAFAARLGLGEDLLTDLERDWEDMSWWESLHANGPFATHPTLPRRRRALLSLPRGAA